MREIKVDLILKGNCGGRFESSEHPMADKRIEAIGKDWIIVRNLVNEKVEFLQGKYIKEELRKYLERE